MILLKNDWILIIVLKLSSILSFEFNIIKQGYSPELDEKIETQYSLEKGFNCIHNYFNNIMRVNDKFLE